MTISETFDALFRAVSEDQDVDAFAALWAENPSVTMWGSDNDERGSGPDAVRALGAAIVAAPHTLHFTWEERREHEVGDVAWVNARGTVAFAGSVVPYRMTAVLVRRDGEWRWHTFNGSIPN